ncbi:MAG: hypothetical protein II047_03635, partial [Bacteroidales bacterium]|nr:hypothetical protein [Bacteroidales bacterium]
MGFIFISLISVKIQLIPGLGHKSPANLGELPIHFAYLCTWLNTKDHEEILPPCRAAAQCSGGIGPTQES